MKLTEVCDFQGGSQPPKEEWSFECHDGYIRMLQIRDFTQSERVTPEYIKIRRNIKTCTTDDILIARYGASLGKILTGLAGAYNVALMRTIPNEKFLRKKYLYYYLQSPFFQNCILNVGSRAAQAGFNKDDLSEIEIQCPALVVQDRIIKQMENLDTIIKYRKEELSKLDTLVKSRFIEMFGDPVMNPMGWRKSTVGAECYYIKDGPHKSPPYVTEDEGIPFISTRNIVNGAGIDWSTAKYISEEDYIKCIKKCHPQKGDILYSKGGTTGIAKLVDTDRKFANWVHVAVLKFHDKLDGRFFESMLNTDYCYDQSQRLTKGIVNKDFVLSAIAQVKIFVPPINLQREYKSFVELADKSKSILQKLLEKQELLRAALMQEYFG